LLAVLGWTGTSLVTVITSVAMAKTLEAFAAQEDLAQKLLREKQDAQRRADVAELKRLTSAENHRQDALKIIHEHVPLLEPPKLRAYKPLRKTPRHTWAPVISDWQMGQLTKLGATGQMFEQTSAITKRQVKDFWTKIEILHEIEKTSKHIEELVIFSLGDLLENDQMRVSQAAGVDSLVTQQAIDVTDLEAWLLNQALARFPKVRLLHVGGNHERTSSKAGNAGLGELGYTDTYSWLIGEFLRRMFERAIDSGRLEIVNHESFFGAAVVAGQRCVYEHGASFRASTGSYGGVSFYSIANAAAGYQKMLDGADLVLMGHHHRAMVLPMGWGWQVMNGALPPSSDFVQSNFKGYGRPSQTLLDLHEQVGLVSWWPLYLETPSMLRPGDFWKKVREK
jgi:hypothetical protein